MKHVDLFLTVRALFIRSLSFLTKQLARITIRFCNVWGSKSAKMWGTTAEQGLVYSSWQCTVTY